MWECIKKHFLFIIICLSSILAFVIDKYYDVLYIDSSICFIALVLIYFALQAIQYYTSIDKKVDIVFPVLYIKDVLYKRLVKKSFKRLGELTKDAETPEEIEEILKTRKKNKR